MEFVAGDALSQRIPPGRHEAAECPQNRHPRRGCARRCPRGRGGPPRFEARGTSWSALRAPSRSSISAWRVVACPSAPATSPCAAEPQSVDGSVSGILLHTCLPNRPKAGSSTTGQTSSVSVRCFTNCSRGHRCFQRASFPETLTAVLKDDPPLRLDWPPSIARIVRRCLRKDPEQRYQHMADVKLDLQEALEEVEQARPGRSDKSGCSLGQMEFRPQ